MWIALDEGRRPTSSARLGRYRQRPVASSTRNALACTQCTARSVRVKRASRRWEIRSGGVAVRPPDPRILVVAEVLPVPVPLVGDELHAREPLHALVAV